jgi:hypothetical protein
MTESIDNAGKTIDLGSTQSYFMKNHQRLSITEQCAEENMFNMTMLEMYNQIETNRK